MKGSLGQAPTTGRPGRAVTTRGSTAAAHSPTPPAGYDASELDSSIKKYLVVCERTIRHAEHIGKQVSTYLERLDSAPAGPDGTMADASQATTLLERLTKAGLNLVKATDELSRLRSFLAGGPDSRPDLSGSGEAELRKMLLVAVLALGWKVTDGAGRAIEVEAL